MSDSIKELLDSDREISPSTVHTCNRCEIPLIFETTSRCFTTRTRFPYTISQVRRASEDGCQVSKELVSALKHRSLLQLLRSHLFKRCSCCGSVRQSLTYMLRCLSLKPFHLLFIAASRDPNAGPYHCFAYFDCGNGDKGTRFNAYTYTGT
jgi:hypothetical protein